jgi:hypothetical protein
MDGRCGLAQMVVFESNRSFINLFSEKSHQSVANQNRCAFTFGLPGAFIRLAFANELSSRGRAHNRR